jgi:hypothetical protein
MLTSTAVEGNKTWLPEAKTSATSVEVVRLCIVSCMRRGEKQAHRRFKLLCGVKPDRHHVVPGRTCSSLNLRHHYPTQDRKRNSLSALLRLLLYAEPRVLSGAFTPRIINVFIGQRQFYWLLGASSSKVKGFNLSWFPEAFIFFIHQKKNDSGMAPVSISRFMDPIRNRTTLSSRIVTYNQPLATGRRDGDASGFHLPALSCVMKPRSNDENVGRFNSPTSISFDSPTVHVQIEPFALAFSAS